MIGNFKTHDYHCVQILREIKLMKAIHAIPGGSEHVPELLDVIISQDESGKDARVFMVIEYFEYDLRTLIMQHLEHMTNK